MRECPLPLSRPLSRPPYGTSFLANKILLLYYHLSLPSFSFRALQASSDTRLSELRNEVKLKQFEAERLRIVYEETVSNLKECQLENEKLAKKLQVI